MYIRVAAVSLLASMGPHAASVLTVEGLVAWAREATRVHPPPSSVKSHKVRKGAAVPMRNQNAPLGCMPADKMDSQEEAGLVTLPTTAPCTMAGTAARDRRCTARAHARMPCTHDLERVGYQGTYGSTR